MYLGSVCRKNWFIIHSQRPAYACVHMEHFEHTDAQLGPKPFQSAWKVSPGEHPTGTVMPTSMVVACRSTGRVSVGENGKRCASSCVGRGVLWFSMTFQFYWKLILLRDIKAAHAESVDCFGISNITEKNFICCLRGWLMIIPWHDIERGRRLNRLRSSVLLTGLNLAVRTKRCIFNAFRTFDWQETVMLHLLIGHTHM